MLEKINDCCNFAIGTLDGHYGWLSEIIALVIVVFIFNYLAKWIISRLHRYYEKEKKFWKDSFIQAIYVPLSYFIWFFAAIQVFDLIISRLFTPLGTESRHCFVAIGAVFAFGWFLLRWKNNVIQQLNTQSKNHQIAIDRGKIGAIDKMSTAAIIFVVILMLLESTDRSMNTIIAFGGVGGLALAFASQEVIANFFGGFMIYLNQPFTIGDWISIPDHKIEGIVEDIGWYMTRVRSLDKRPIYIPNSIFSRLIVITPSRMSHRVLKETISLRTQDMPKIKKIVNEIEDMLEQHFDIDKAQGIIVRFAGFGIYSLDIEVHACITPTDKVGFMKAKEDLLFKIANIIEKNEAQFANPTQNIEFSNFSQSQTFPPNPISKFSN